MLLKSMFILDKEVELFKLILCIGIKTLADLLLKYLAKLLCCAIANGA